MRSKLSQIALRVTLIYWIISVAWILLSDRFLGFFVKNINLLSAIQTYKGWAFVTATAFLLYFLLKNQFKRWELESTERRRAETALIESEQEFRSLIESSIDAILLTIPDGRILSANPEACRIFGWTEEELRSIDRSGVIDPEDPRLAAAIEERTRTGKFRGELTLIRKDGTKFPAEISSSVLKDRDGNERTSMIIRDVTERRRSEELLRHKEEYQRALIENISDAIAVLNADLENVYRSPSRRRILGYGEDDPLGAFDTVHPDDYALMKEKLGMLARTPGSTVNLDLRLRHRDGSWRNVEATGVNLLDNPAVNGIVVNYRDVTERKETEDAMQLWVAALQSAANAIVITDRDGNIQFVNAAFTHLTGYQADEAIGRNPRMLKSGKQPDSFYRNIWETISAGRAWHGQLENRRKDGSLYDEELTITPVRDRSSNVTHYIAIKDDISERKRLQEQLIQSQKMESIGVLAAGIAHDFNNVLGVIMGHASLLLRSHPPDDGIKKGVDVISKAAERGASLVRQMLTFARKNDVTFSVVSLNDSVKELQKLFYETFPRTITLVCNLDRGLPLVLADSTQIHQVLLNLSVNARDAMQGSGAIIVSTGTAAANEVKQRFPDAPAARYAMLSLSDNGQGMDEGTRQHIFEPFFTTKGPGKGTGLGLSVVFGIMENHKGFIDVVSEQGHGTTFILYFPVTEAGSDARVPEEDDAVIAAGGKETILVVEDEDMLIELAESILTSNGYKVITAADGEEAVDVYERRWKEIDLVFSDYGLPKLSGEEVLKRMRTINPEVRVVIATGFVEPEQKANLITNGAIDVIMKPYKHGEVLSKVREVLDSLPG